MSDNNNAKDYIITTIFRDKIDSHLLTHITIKVIEVVESIVLTPTSLESKRVVEHTFNANLTTQEFDDITQVLYEISLENPEVNSFIQVDNQARRFKSLFVFDMDSTLIKEEVIDIMAEIAGCEDKIKSITERAMNGELDFKASLVERVALLKGQSTDIFNQVLKRINFTDGVRDLCLVLKSFGIKMAVVSGGFLPLASVVKEELNLNHHFANELEIDLETNTLTGRVINDIITPERKEQIVKELAEKYQVDMQHVVCVGDGANDLLMLKLAGLGIAFNAKPKVQKEVKIRLNMPNISDILYIIGLNENYVNPILFDFEHYAK